MPVRGSVNQALSESLFLCLAGVVQVLDHSEE